MALPEPEPGLVFRYDFLWRREARAGRDTSKQRPACIAVATASEMISQRVVILPITHSQPTGDTIGIELTASVRRALGLDDQPCWVVVSEYNIDNWPNPGIAPLPNSRTSFAYGFLPPDLFERIKAEFLKRYDARKAVRR
ncbi:MAG: hypothetical protein JSR60_14660 [Proteobacteria bacterium]|nr:hypothetical protein [Pseudomonadota bacterium]